MSSAQSSSSCNFTTDGGNRATQQPSYWLFSVQWSSQTVPETTPELHVLPTCLACLLASTHGRHQPQNAALSYNVGSVNSCSICACASCSCTVKASFKCPCSCTLGACTACVWTLVLDTPGLALLKLAATTQRSVWHCGCRLVARLLGCLGVGGSHLPSRNPRDCRIGRTNTPQAIVHHVMSSLLNAPQALLLPHQDILSAPQTRRLTLRILDLVATQRRIASSSWNHHINLPLEASSLSGGHMFTLPSCRRIPTHPSSPWNLSKSNFNSLLKKC